MSGDRKVGFGARPVEAMSSRTELEALRSARRASQREGIDRWGAALAQGDVDEVDRLVRQSRAERVEVATSSRLGTLVGQLDPLAPIAVLE